MCITEMLKKTDKKGPGSGRFTSKQKHFLSFKSSISSHDKVTRPDELCPLSPRSRYPSAPGSQSSHLLIPTSSLSLPCRFPEALDNPPGPVPPESCPPPRTNPPPIIRDTNRWCEQQLFTPIFEPN